MTWKARRHRRPYPYYKIQVLDEVSLTWTDLRGVFDTVGKAREYIARKVAPQGARIMVVGERERHVLEEQD